MSLSKDLVAATAEPLVLSILSRKESYGYALIKEVHALSGGRVTWTEGMLYPVLHRLEEQGFIRSVWRDSDIGRKRKYYSIEKKGQKRLKAQLEEWDIAASVVAASRGISHV